MVSCYSAIELIQILPKALALQSSDELETVNKILEREVIKRTAELEASQERMEIFITNAPTAIAMLDDRMRYLTVSQKWISDYKIDKKNNIIGRYHYEIFAKTSDRWKEIYQKC